MLLPSSERAISILPLLLHLICPAAEANAVPIPAAEANAVPIPSLATLPYRTAEFFTLTARFPCPPLQRQSESSNSTAFPHLLQLAHRHRFYWRIYARVMFALWLPMQTLVVTELSLAFTRTPSMTLHSCATDMLTRMLNTLAAGQSCAQFLQTVAVAFVPFLYPLSHPRTISSSSRAYTPSPLKLLDLLSCA